MARRIYDAARKLVQELRTRGLEPRLSVRAGVRARAQPGLAATVAELTGTHPEQARALVRDRQIVLDSAPPELAMAMANRIEKAGGLVEFELGHVERLAFVPEHPLRGMQPCERLIMRGRDLALSHGPLARPTQVVALVERGFVHQVLTAFDRERGRWASTGMREIGGEAELLECVSARDATLEAELRTAKNRSFFEVAAVYGDWLQHHGDPRGLVATASLALRRAGDDTREQAAQELSRIVDEYASHLLGSLVHVLSPDALRWLGPVLTAARLSDATTRPEVAELHLLEGLLGLPVSVTLRELVLAGRFVRIPELFATISRSACASSLRTLSLQGANDMRMAGGHFERLQWLALGNVSGELVCELRLPALRRLSLEFAEARSLPDLRAAFVGLDAPKLDQLDLRVEGPARRGSLLPALEELLSLPSFARLRSLALGSRSGGFDGLDEVLPRLPVAATLERLDLDRAVFRDATRTRLAERMPKLVGVQS